MTSSLLRATCPGVLIQLKPLKENNVIVHLSDAGIIAVYIYIYNYNDPLPKIALGRSQDRF